MALTLIETCLGSVMTWDEVREALLLPVAASTTD
jgi:hypothetical protein